MPPKKGSAAPAAKKQGGNKKASSTAGKGKKPSTEEPEEKGKARFSVLHPMFVGRSRPLDFGLCMIANNLATLGS